MQTEVYVWDGNALGETLRTRRRELGIRQEDAARELGFSVRLVSEIENGRDTVAYGKILRYAGYLAMDVVLKPRG